MTVRQLEANVRSSPGLAIIDLRGDIDSFSEQELNRAYGEAEANEPGAVLLNFTEVDYINSTGIALIVSLLARARKAHRRLITFGLSDHYVEIFQITRLVDFMSVFSDEGSAMASALENP
jgi:anti-sigma B factor antagonist